MYPEEVVERFWELTKPEDEEVAKRYKRALKETLSLPKRDRFWEPFFRPKKSGGFRRIVPANEPLRFVHYVLYWWIIHNFPHSEDYCYTGRSVKAAVTVHAKSNYAAVFDLRSAFDQISASKVDYWFHFHRPDIDRELIRLFVDLVTFEGYTPQGCVTTPYVYNVVVNSLDRHLRTICSELNIPAYTRYSDNICFSSPQRIDFLELGKQVRRYAIGFGFELSMSNMFEGEFEYLGVLKGENGLGLPEEKIGEYLDQVTSFSDSPDPVVFYHKVTGILNWIVQICGSNIHPDLLRVIETYFRKVGRYKTFERVVGKAYGRLL